MWYINSCLIQNKIFNSSIPTKKLYLFEMTCFFVGRTFSKYGATMESNFTNQRARADKVRGINAKEAMTSSTTLSGKLHWDNQCSLIAPTKSATTYKLVYASHKEMKTEVSIKTTLRDKNTNESKEKTEKKKKPEKAQLKLKCAWVVWSKAYEQTSSKHPPAHLQA